MESLGIIFRLLAVSQVVLFAAAVVLSSNPWRIRALGAGLGIGVACYLIIPPVIDYWGRNVAAVLIIAAEVLPLLLLLFVRVLFDDLRRLPRAEQVIVAIYFALWLGTALPESPGGMPVLAFQIGKLAIVLRAIWIVLAGRSDDLVDARLRLRTAFATALSLAAAAVVTTELVTAMQVPVLIDLIGMALICGLSFASNLAFMRWNPSFSLIGEEPASRTTRPAESRDPLLDQIDRLMNQERLYADHDLRIAGLAERCGIPEYRLRRTINKGLGYRNFNQFVNRFRLREAAERLIAEPRVAILTIAIDVGFRSISSFNAAFRAHYGCSPSEYRRRQVPESR